jgi:Cys-tRNA synthase (O-phospho-L-seryl-tRNA:Cys-tRNA synthase)
MADYISINGKESKYGIKLSGKADKVIEEIKKHTNEKGYFNFELKKRTELGKYGETHYVKVDDWKPTPKAEENDMPF